MDHDGDPYSILDLAHQFARRRFPALGRAIRFPDHEGAPMEPPPLLGEDDDQVLGEVLGYPPERIAELRREGVIV